MAHQTQEQGRRTQGQVPAWWKMETKKTGHAQKIFYAERWKAQGAPGNPKIPPPFKHPRKIFFPRPHAHPQTQKS